MSFVRLFALPELQARHVWNSIAQGIRLGRHLRSHLRKSRLLAQCSGRVACAGPSASSLCGAAVLLCLGLELGGSLAEFPLPSLLVVGCEVGGVVRERGRGTRGTPLLLSSRGLRSCGRLGLLLLLHTLHISIFFFPAASHWKEHGDCTSVAAC